MVFLELSDEIVVYDDIVQLYVSMSNVLLVQVSNSFYDLFDDPFNFILWQKPSRQIPPLDVFIE